jgi:hypothetical protein
MEYEEHQKHKMLARLLAYLVLPVLLFMFIATVVLIYSLF